MRVLIVGGTRFIGAHVTRQLFDQGADVTVLHRGHTENPILPPIRHVRDPAAEYPILRFANVVTSRDWDVVVHMVLMGEADARCAVDAFAGRAGRLVMVSSGDVYRAYGRLTRSEPGPPDPLPLDEEAPQRSALYPYRGQEDQIGPFAKDYEKILAERVLTEADALPWVVLRLPKVYGPEDNADLATVYSFASQPDWRWTHGYVENVAAAVVLAAMHPAALARVLMSAKPIPLLWASGCRICRRGRKDSLSRRHSTTHSPSSMTPAASAASSAFTNASMRRRQWPRSPPEYTRLCLTVAVKTAHLAPAGEYRPRHCAHHSPWGSPLR